MLLSKCHSMSLRIGKKTSFMLAGLSLRGNRAMWSFLHAFMLRKHFENLPPKTSPNHLWALQVGAIDTKLLDSGDMSWFGLLHFISEELATATFMETKETALSQMYSKRRPNRNASSAAPKSKALTFCCHHYDLDLDILDHVCACTAYKPSSYMCLQPRT